MQQNYSEKIKQHCHHPLNAGKLANYTHTAEQINPLCGDEIKIYLEIKNSKIKNLSYEARGCMICVASASVVSEYARGKNLNQIKKLSGHDIEKMLGVSISPAREQCILLFLQAIRLLHVDQ